MKFEDARLLRAWALLQLEVAASKAAPGALRDVEKGNIHKSKGFRLLRAWFTRLSPGARVRARKWLQGQIDGVRKARQMVGADELTAAELLEINTIIEEEGTEDAEDANQEHSGTGTDGADDASRGR